MSKNANIEQLISDEKIEQLEQEEINEHFANNFSILEPNQYDDDEFYFQREIKEQSKGFSIIHI